MDVRLPYSRKKRYLSGIDWVIAALNAMTRRHGGGGNASQIVMELRGPFSETALRGTLLTLSRELPVLSGRPARDWNLAPYWNKPAAGSERAPRVELQRMPAEDPPAVAAALASVVNAPFRKPREHVLFHVLSVGPDRHYVAMKFDHRLFDAGGAEAFLNLVECRRYGDCSDRLGAISLVEPAHLSEWRRKFECGRQFVRAIRALSQVSLRILPRPAPAGRIFRFKVVSFNPEESDAILDRAYDRAGYLLAMPYALATAVRMLDPVFRARNLIGTDYVASVSINLRAPENAGASLFFNHVSFLFFSIAADCVSDGQRLLDSIRRQLYDQLKSRFPQALAESSLLMRIAPLPLLSRLMLLPLRGEFASFGFSYIGRTAYTFPRFMDAEVVNLFHMPLVPIPPGVGLVVNRFNDRFNVVLSYLDGVLTEAEAGSIERDAPTLFLSSQP